MAILGMLMVTAKLNHQAQTYMEYRAMIALILYHVVSDLKRTSKVGVLTFPQEPRLTENLVR
jgi:hypothetical protein